MGFLWALVCLAPVVRFARAGMDGLFIASILVLIVNVSSFWIMAKTTSAFELDLPIQFHSSISNFSSIINMVSTLCGIILFALAIVWLWGHQPRLDALSIVVAVGCLAIFAADTQTFRLLKRTGLPLSLAMQTAGTGVVPSWISRLALCSWGVVIIGLILLMIA